MAERRMFAKSIIDSDAFLDMPLSSQALYFHLSMRADDEGFVNNPKKIQRMIGGSDDDMKVLILKNFLIPFDSGVVVIKHWRIHNWIRSDRITPTNYTEERRLLDFKSNGAYTLNNDPIEEDVSQMSDGCLTDVRRMSDGCQSDVSTGKDSLVERRIEKSSEEKYNNNYIKSPNKKYIIPADDSESYNPKPVRKQIPPTVEAVAEYCSARNNGIDAEEFCDFYTARGWKVGKDKMVDWQATVRWWERNHKSKKPKKVYSEDETAWKAADWMSRKLNAMHPTIQQVSPDTLQTWASVFEKIEKEDMHSPEEILEVMRYAYQDDFWSMNISSPWDLRKNYLKLLARAEKDGWIK